MCGITGFWQDCSPTKDALIILRKMTESLQHRGPDSSDTWNDKKLGIHLGHCRLSILDPSSEGSQPMSSACGRFVIVYNGEIYNHLDIRKLLENEESTIQWRGHSDTETLLAAIQVLGINTTLKHLNGMYAFALWDRKHHTLTLVRDKIGEKPLYYLSNGSEVVFASEIRAFRAFSKNLLDISYTGLASLLTYSYIAAPDTIYSEVKKLSPGSMIVFSSSRDEGSTQQKYWELHKTRRSSIYESAYKDKVLWKRTLSNKLTNAVSSRLLSDVPVGCFLSGGVDSSLVTAIMQQHYTNPIRTFTIGFDKESHNEATHAKKVSEYLGTEHSELYLTEKELLQVVPDLPKIWDEPFADSSQIPTYLVSLLARREVKVCLSGDGGDELFGGYKRYKKAISLWSRLSRYPIWSRTFVTYLSELSFTYLPSYVHFKALKKIYEMREVLISNSDEALYNSLRKHWKNPSTILTRDTQLRKPKMLDSSSYPCFLQRMMHIDTTNYLPEDILMKVDRASMSVGLESRAPLLDTELIEFMWHSPTNFKIDNKVVKKPLKEELTRFIPEEFINRPKMGFAVPIADWLRGPLKEWANELLHPELLKKQGIINPVIVSKIWEQHQRKEWTWEYLLWDLLMFQSWLCYHHEE